MATASRRPCLTEAPSRPTPLFSPLEPRVPILVRKLGIQLPIYPIKGYSLTIPIGNRLSPPTIASVDEHKSRRRLPLRGSNSRHCDRRGSLVTTRATSRPISLS